MWERLKTAGTVIILTGLIWSIADRQVTDTDTFMLRVAVKANAPRTAARVETPNPPQVEATISGTRGRLASFRAALEHNNPPFEYVLAQDELSEGSRPMRARDLLEGSREFQAYGVRVNDVNPASVQVLVEKLEDVTLKLEPNFGTLEVAEASWQPQSVTVARLPHSIIQTRLRSGTLKVAAEAAVRQWILAHANQPRFQVDVNLSIPEGPNDAVFLPTPRVRISGRVVGLVQAARKGPVQIVLAVPPDMMKRFVVTPTARSNMRPDIFVRGPRNLVEALTPAQIFAYVDVLASDAGNAGATHVIRRAPKIVLPAGLELDREPEEIEIELTERAAGPESAG